MNAYKLFRLSHSGKLLSYSAGSEATLVYEQGVVTWPIVEGSKLFVFENEYDARMFHMLPDANYELWLCETGPLEEIKHIASPRWTHLGILDFWLKKDVPNLWRTIAPFGTRVTDWVKPLEKVG